MLPEGKPAHPKANAFKRQPHGAAFSSRCNKRGRVFAHMATFCFPVNASFPRTAPEDVRAFGLWRENDLSGKTMTAI